MTRKVLLAPLVAALMLLAAAPAQAETVVGITPGNTLISFDSASPANVTTVGAVTGLGANETIRGLDVRPSDGQLYAVTATTGSAANSILKTYTVNPSNAAATLVGATAAALPGAADVPTGWSILPRDTATDTAAQRARYVNTNDENARIHLPDGTLGGNDTDITPAATSTIIATAHAPNTGGTTATTYAIDRTDSQLSRVGGDAGATTANGGVVTDLAPLGLALNQANDAGFDVSPNSGTAFGALTDSADNLTRLYTLNLVTAVQAGAVTTVVGPIGNGTIEVRSIAVLPNPPPAQLAAEQSQPVTTTQQQPSPRDTRRAIVLIALGSSVRSYSSILRGFRYEFSADEPGTATAALSIRGSGAAATLARGRATLRAAGKTRIRVRPTASGKRVVRRLRRKRRRVRATLTTTFRDLAGNRTISRKRLRLRR
jgi:Domain of unknown function (DUF4394)